MPNEDEPGRTKQQDEKNASSAFGKPKKTINLTTIHPETNPHEENNQEETSSSTMKDLLCNIIDDNIMIEDEVTIEYDSDLESEDLENPFLHEEGCPLAWKPPEIKTAWNDELAGNALPCSCIDNNNLYSPSSHTKIQQDKKSSIARGSHCCEDIDCFCQEAVIAACLPCLQEKSRCVSALQAKRLSTPAYIGTGRPLTVACQLPSTHRVLHKIETKSGDQLIGKLDEIKSNSFSSSLSYSSQSEVEEEVQGGQNKQTSSPRRSQVLPSTPIYPRTSARGISREHLHQLLVELSAEQTETSPNNQPQPDSGLSEEMKRIIIEICEKIPDSEETSDLATKHSANSPQVTPFIIHVSEEESSYSEFDESDNEIENILQELLDEELLESEPISQKPKFYIKRSENNINFDGNQYLFSKMDKNLIEDEWEKDKETVLNIIEPQYDFTEEDSVSELLFEPEDPYPELSANRKEGVYWSSVGLVKDFRGLQNGLDLLADQKSPGVMGDSGKPIIMNLGKEMNLSGDTKITREEEECTSKMAKCSEKGKKNPFKIWNRFINIFKSKR